MNMPVIEKGVPMPPIKPDQRRDRKRKPSPWPEFLKRLEIGDSFLVEYPAATSAKKHAIQLGIKLVWQYAGGGPKGMRQERMWRVA